MPFKERSFEVSQNKKNSTANTATIISNFILVVYKILHIRDNIIHSNYFENRIFRSSNIILSSIRFLQNSLKEMPYIIQIIKYKLNMPHSVLDC